MRTFLEFRVDDRVLREDRETGIATADRAALYHTYFVMPVRFTVSGSELLERPASGRATTWVAGPSSALTRTEARTATSVYLDLPLLYVAVAGLEQVRLVADRGKSHLELPGGMGRLDFSATGTTLRVASTVNGRRSDAPLRDVVKAFEEFAAQVRVTLLERAPELGRRSDAASLFAPGP